MSGINDIATVTLNVNGAKAKQEMDDLKGKIESTSKKISELKEKIKDPNAFNEAKANVEKYGKEVERLKARLAEAQDNVTRFNDRAKDPKAFNDAKANVEKYAKEIESLDSRIVEAVSKWSSAGSQTAKDQARTVVRDLNEQLRQVKSSFYSAKKTMEELDPAPLDNARKSVEEIKRELKQANSELSKAKKEMDDYNPKNLEKAKKDLAGYNKRMAEMQSGMEGVARALATLDSATPRQLEKSLVTLRKRLKDLEPGTEVWQLHVEKIRVLQERLGALRSELREQESTWDKFKSWAMSAWPALDLISRGYDQLVSKMREYVDAYAEMDQEMASVRKFTGMDEKSVARLNEEFKNLDTRSSREQLNKLAQEAGRLGKSSEEDVLGFVRAADKVNVALDDLGDGATLTLSKLTDTFGVEEVYGTEKSLLKVGSVINELSQNCSASAPYIANFTERMAGVGVQADMTIPQIMGFAAVLDASAQPVEASATALSQVIVRLYQEPAKYAEVAGLEVESFTKLLKEDANSALILFLETLNKAGGMDVLSPMFKDMGETGSRAITALSSLAANIDKVKAQQEVASEAFREGTSVEKEFAVQNSTVQAGLEKVKNAAHEFQVQLGEKLYPVVQHVLSSTSAVMKGLLMLVSFIYDHRAALLALVAAYVSYNAAVRMAVIKTKAWNAVCIAGKGAMALWTAAVKLGSAAIALCSGNVTKARAAWLAFSTALKASPLGIAAAAVAFLASKIIMAATATDEYKESMDEAMKSSTSFSEEARKETRELDSLFGKLQGAKKGTKEYDDAKKSIISKYGIYLQGLIDEKGEINNLTEAYRRLTWAARKAAQVRGVNAARESLDSTFFREVDSLTEQIRKALKSEGMGDRQAEKLVTSISQAVGSGNDVSEADRAEILAFEQKHRSSFAGIFGDRSAMDLVHELRDKRHDYQTRSKKLDAMDTRYFSTVENDDLRAGIDRLTEALADASKKEFDVSVAVKDAVTAEKIKDVVGREKVTGQAQPAPAPSLLSPGSSAPASLLSPSPKQQSVLPSQKTVVKEEALVLTADLHGSGKQSLKGTLSREQAEKLLQELMYEYGQRELVTGSGPSGLESGSGQPTTDNGQPKTSPDRFASEKAWREQQEAEARIAYAQGIDTYTEYTLRMKEISEEYNQMLLDRDDLTADERLKTQADYWESVNSLFSAGTKFQVEQENKDYEAAVARLQQQHTELLNEGELSAEQLKNAEKVHQEAIEQLQLEHLRKLVDMYKEGSDERLKAQKALNDAELAAARRHQEELERLRAEAEKKLEEERKKREDEQKRRDSLPGEKHKGAVESGVDEAKREFVEKKEVLDQALSDGLISQEEYDNRLRRIQQELSSKILGSISQIKSEWASLTVSMMKAWKEFAESIKDGDPFVGLQGAIGATAALMASVMQQLSTMTQAELQVQTAAIESRYDKEIQRAEGNSYRVAKLEKQKEAEIAKAKNDANRKMFAMQVIQAVAQTAQNAVEGFGAGLQAGFPMALWLAPALAALATAQGAVQIAAIKKQQQASEAQGYSEGGFTKPGAVDEPAGIVHAGEWVASQKLLASPVARPMIEALDYAQRTNTIGSLRSEDVSRSITATQSLSMIAQGDPSAALMISAVASNAGAISRLLDRLNEPFVTVNTVTGDTGIKQAQDEYSRLMNNKSPKSRRNANNYQR